jgi:hypothetical protein
MMREWTPLFVPDPIGQTKRKIPVSLLELSCAKMQLTQSAGEGKEKILDMAAQLVNVLYTKNINVKKRAVGKALARSGFLVCQVQDSGRGRSLAQDSLCAKFRILAAVARSSWISPHPGSE